MNEDGDEDIVMRDNNSVYIKYANQNFSQRAGFAPIYFPTLENPNFTQQQITRNIKYADQNREVKNFQTIGQNYERLLLSWTNSTLIGDKPDAYLIKLNHRIDTFNDRDQIIDDIGEDAIHKVYILVLPEGTSLTGLEINGYEDDIE